MTTATGKQAEVIDAKFLGLKFKRPGIVITSDKKVMEIREMYMGFAGKISSAALYKLSEELKTGYKDIGLGEGLKRELKKGPPLRQRAKHNRSEHVTLLVIKYNLTVILCYLLAFDQDWIERNM